MKRDIHEFQFLKEYYGMDESRFLERIAEPTLTSLPDPFRLWEQFEPLIAYLKNLVKLQKKVVIYGDYDVDGLTSTAVLVGTFDRLGLKTGYYIPSRYLDGYGLSRDRVTQFHELGYDVIITVDNGISETETIEYAISLGLEVIVIDHHEVTHDVLPPARFIFHQKLSQLTDYNISAAFLALLVSYGLLGHYDPYYVTLAGMAVFSDAMPLLKANLVLARLALKNFQRYRYRPLGQLIGNGSLVLDYDTFSFELIPALNAVGRVDKTLYINKVVQYLLSTDEKFIRFHAQKIKALNELRKTYVKNFDGSKLHIDETLISGYVEAPLGLLGLLANKLLNQYHRPVALFTDDPLGADRFTGSIRTPDGYNTAQTLKDHCSFLVRFGGHAQAAGFTLLHEDREHFETALRAHLLWTPSEKSLPGYIPLDIENIGNQYALVEEFGPYGNGLDKPLFGLEVAKTKLRFSRDGKHLLTKIGNCKIVRFFCSQDDLSIYGDPILFIGFLKQSEFNGVKTIDLNVTDQGVSVEA